MGRSSSARQRLLNAAGDLFWEKSYHSVSIDEVCARAGVLKGSLYYFFDSKSTLTVAVLQHFWKTVAEPGYEKHFSLVNPPLARISNFVGWLQRLQLQKYSELGRIPGWPFFTLGCELGDREPAISKELCDIESAELSYYESAILDAIDQHAIEPGIAREEALSMRAAVAGILARARILNDPDELSALTTLPTRALRHLRSQHL
jgi:TetR/AcrR family transcriptional repressor of nem operon